jgi:hypothetical protein
MATSLTATPAESVPLPADEATAIAVREELERLLASRHFRSSKHYTSFLRYVVEHALQGDVDNFKERTLGIEVFGRSPGYDTNQDPVVRTSASEIRKRLALYYRGQSHTGAVQIDLAAGSYVPQFRLQVPEPPPAEVIPSSSRSRRSVLLTGLGLAAGIPAALATFRYFARPATALSQFWAPVLKSADPLLLCVQGHSDQLPMGVPIDPVTGPTTLQATVMDKVILFDALALAKLAGFVQAGGKKFRAIRQDSATLADLKEGPVVLVGGFSWPAQLGSPLRFTRARDGNSLWIRDQQRPDNRQWSLDHSLPAKMLTTDYAIVSRFLDPKTGKLVIIVSGIEKYGTLAAAEFLTEPEYFEPVASHAPQNWAAMNNQIVLATAVINGQCGRPQILATHFW